METPVLAPPRILILEEHKALQSLLQFILQEAGYAVSLSFTLEAAWEALAQETFALILANLPLGVSHPGSFTVAHQLRRRAHPTPVGLLVTHVMPEEEAQRAGFAFALPMPFNLDDLLGLVATTLQAPLSPTHERSVSLVERFVRALEHDDHATLLRLCSEDITWYRLTPSPDMTARRVQGKDAMSATLATCVAPRALTAISDLQCYAVPKGVVACYTQVWTTPEGNLRREATTALFHFEGGQIAQIGLRPHLLGGQEQTQAG